MPKVSLREIREIELDRERQQPRYALRDDFLPFLVAAGAVILGVGYMYWNLHQQTQATNRALRLPVSAYDHYSQPPFTPEPLLNEPLPTHLRH